MYYELYIDVLFLVNFMMDYILLLLVRRMLKCTATHGNIWYGGDDRFFFDVCDHHIAGSIYVVEIHIVPCICKHSND